MNILVAGAAGFVGSNLCARLLKDGHKVWAVDSFATGRSENIETLKKNKNFIFAECKVESDVFLTFIKDSKITFDRVFDLACPTGVPNIEFLGEEMMEACSSGTKNLLKVALEHKAKFLITSSYEIYGNPEVSPQAETYTGNVDPVGWRANYEEGKRFAETWTMLFVRKYKLDARIVRLFNIYGPQMSPADFRVIPRFMTQALTGKDVTVHGEGKQQRTLCFVSDLIEGLLIAIEKGTSGEVYNLGSDQTISMLDLAKKVISIIESKSNIIFTPRASHDHDSRMPVLAKIHALGWKQTVPLEEGLEATAEYFAEYLKNKEGVNLKTNESVSA